MVLQISAQEFTVDEMTFNITGTGVCEACLEMVQSETVTVPSTVKYEGKDYTVKGIYRGDLDNMCENEVVRKITLPNTIEHLREYAFAFFIALEDINLPTGLKTIESFAFSNTLIAAIDIPDGVKFPMAYNVFESCPNLKSARLPADLDSIPNGMFNNASLESITLHKNIKYIGSCAFACTNIETIDIPDGVRFNPKGYTFSSCQNLKSARLPADLDSIPNSMFDNTSLESMTLPKNLRYIGPGAFSSTKINHVEIPSSVTYLGGSVFAYTKIDHIEIPSSVTYIGGSAFAYTDIDHIEIPSSVTYIGENVISGTKIKTIDIPASVSFVGGFSYCQDLESVNFAQQGYSAEETKLGRYCFSNCDKLSDIKLPKNLKAIPICAFYNCLSLESLDIPDGVEEIGESFIEGTPIIQLRLPLNLTELNKFAFKGCNLQHISISENAPNFTVFNDMLLSKDKSTLVAILPQYQDTITIPASVSKLAPGIFRVLPNAPEIKISEGNQWLTMYENGIYDKDKTTIYYYPYNLGGKITLPETLVKIEDYAFYFNSKWASAENRYIDIEFPKSLKEIGVYAFYYRTFDALNIPPYIEKLGFGAFDLITANTVNIGVEATKDQVMVLEEDFLYGSTIKYLHFGSAVKYLPKWGCVSLKGLRSIVFDEGLEEIAESAFLWAELPLEMTFPKSLKKFGSGNMSDGQSWSGTFKRVTFLSQVPPEGQPFHGSTFVNVVCVPKCALELYENCEFANRVLEGFETFIVTPDSYRELVENFDCEGEDLTQFCLSGGGYAQPVSNGKSGFGVAVDPSHLLILDTGHKFNVGDKYLVYADVRTDGGIVCDNNFAEFTSYPYPAINDYVPTIENGLLCCGDASDKSFYLAYGVPTEPEKEYTIKIRIRGERSTPLRISFGGDTNRVKNDITVSNEWQDFVFTIKAMSEISYLKVVPVRGCRGLIEVASVQITTGAEINATCSFTDKDNAYGRAVDMGSFNASNEWQQICYEGEITEAEDGTNAVMLRFNVVDGPENSNLVVDNIHVAILDNASIRDVIMDTRKGDGNIYTITGSFVRSGIDLRGLAPGIYIVDGQKMIIR